MYSQIDIYNLELYIYSYYLNNTVSPIGYCCIISKTYKYIVIL